MRHHNSCANWCYDSHPLALNGTLAKRCRRLRDAINRNPALVDKALADLRVVHRVLFRGMAPLDCRCVVGCYRGCKQCAALTDCRVGVGHDDRVGAPPLLVAGLMHDYTPYCRRLLFEFNAWVGDGDRFTTEALQRFVSVASSLLERLLRTHPFADGNGHVARAVVAGLLVKAGYSPLNWDIHEKKECYEALHAHRRGEPGALQSYLMSALFAA